MRHCLLYYNMSHFDMAFAPYARLQVYAAANQGFGIAFCSHELLTRQLNSQW